MSTRRSVQTKTLLQWLAALIVVVLVVAVIGQLRRSAPHEPPEFVVPGAEDPTDPASDIVTCERSLPQIPTTPQGVESVEPVGRVTSSEILECPDEFDRQVVIYIGEVVGDVLHRDGGAWVLMNDDAYALEAGPLRSHGDTLGYNSGLSVWLDGDLADLAARPGGPDRRGDILRVRGVIHRVDPADGGGLTLRAFEGEMVAEGQPVEVPLHTGQVLVAVLFTAAAGAVVIAERFKARHR